MQESVSMHKSPTPARHSRMNQARSEEERQKRQRPGGLMEIKAAQQNKNTSEELSAPQLFLEIHFKRLRDPRHLCFTYLRCGIQVNFESNIIPRNLVLETSLLWSLPRLNSRGGNSPLFLVKCIATVFWGENLNPCAVAHRCALPTASCSRLSADA